ncbi:protein Skeletor, isoforms B/C isoform X2 [Condylostylus longicornis]|uniref:protein Skeletor, isoforms B/C isoform X2 n=1 Tax=Condylostylus longicornis TaxID=2530218 RepID=UPI00244DC9DC|nr:protein Skeletor, isoforms B/C isoform X2 [Condylostylus longicornis]
MKRSIANNFINFRLLFFGIISTFLITTTNASYPYYGTKIGALTQLHHGVSGDVYAVDSRTIFLKNFNYDGEAPAAYFYVGNTDKPSNDGWRLRDEKGSTAPVTKRYRNKDITLSLPEGKTLRDVKWFSFWCDEFAVNFGDVRIPANLDYPKPQKISALKGVHAVSSDNIVIVDAQTLLIPNFSYDGEAPDAKFWVGRGTKPSPQGLRIPDENGKETPLRQYDKKTIVLTLPGDLTVFDIGHFGVWCEAFTVDFGHIRIPDGLNVPPSLKMLGISPQSKLNCEVLYDDLAFEVRWAVAGESIVVQLVAKLDDNEYMSFGISPNKAKTEMIGADVVVAWVDKATGKGFAQDYFLDDKSQCSGTRGSCPDTRLEEKTNSIRLLNAAMVNGYSIVTYQRSLKASDKYDLPIPINGSHAIVWAIGPLNQRNEVSFHSQYTKKDQLVDFGRQPTWNCPQPEQDRETRDEDEDEEYYDSRPSNGANGNRNRKPQLQEANQKEQPQSEQLNGRPRRPVPTPKPVSKNGAWAIPPIQCDEPDDGVFYAQLGPTGGKHGYPAITGHVGWGISWYINGLLIPEIHVMRGKTYRFVVEGGNDSDTPAKYHPFYITDDPVGGYEYKTEEEKNEVKIFAGVHKSRSGKIIPTGVGRLCNWTPDQNLPPADDYQSFGAYQRTLTLICEDGEPGIVTWTPDSNTPDTVYYHCFTHRYLGWKIHVHDTCEETQASEVDEVYAEPDGDFLAESSIRHETRIRPNDFLDKHEKDLIKHHNMAGKPPKMESKQLKP